MKTTTFRKRIATAIAATLLASPFAGAEDIDLFTSAPPTAGSGDVNILIVLDNSANWSRNDQAWPTGKQGESELRALYTVLGDAAVGTNVNMGLMMLTSGATDGAYMRFAIRNMTPANKLAFQEMIGTATCPAGNNSLTGKANCILRNFDSPSEKTNSASTRYSAALFEAFKYFGGYSEPAFAKLDRPGGAGAADVSATKFGPQRYAVLDAKADPGAFTDAAMTTYRSPITAANQCGRNYVIFIANGYPSQDNAASLLTTVNQNWAGVSVAGQPKLLLPGVIGNKDNLAASWANYLYNTDVSSQPGQQRVGVYTIDVFNAKPDPDNQTALLKGMAKFGGGAYFEAKKEEDIIKALRDIIVEIQAVNSVFASASLPINATNRSQNENQVFIGMFRPDPDARPKWYGNLKQYQAALINGEAALADKNGDPALAASTGFVQACANSFWTTDSGTYWSFSSASIGTCSTTALSPFSDAPDGGVVEKGAAAEVLRRGNNRAPAPFTVNRTMKTCVDTPCAGLVTFDSGNVAQARVGALTAAEHTRIIDFTRGLDVLNENGDTGANSLTEPRPSIHGDIAHSRPLPVNFSGTRGVEVYYGSNDGTFKAVSGKTGEELWSFIAPEHHGKLRRLYDNAPQISYPHITLPGAQRKDYFFDGSAGLYQNGDNSKVWIFPTMRRGGRMLYAFDVSTTTPVHKWSLGCPNAAPNDTGCTSGLDNIGQTWSAPNVAFIKGFGGGGAPVLIVGGGYDTCEDMDAAVNLCVSGTTKGSRVYVINADTGAVIKTFTTSRSVAADVTLIDRDFDGMVDHAFVADVAGGLYRIDFVEPSTLVSRGSGAWSITKIAQTQTTGSRKFLFAPSALAFGDKVYLTIGSGDRERPLIDNYPYMSPVTNRFYMFIDDFGTPATPVDLDGPLMENFSTVTDCNSTVGAGKRGWFMDLNAGRGEQTVTSSVIFGGTVFFSTNRPVSAPIGTCAVNLGEARGYAVNLFNASGVVGSGGLCGGDRSGVFTGGGLPPSPVVGTVPISTPGGTKPISVLIGGIDLKTGGGPPIQLQQPPVPIKQTRQRTYWYRDGDR